MSSTEASPAFSRLHGRAACDRLVGRQRAQREAPEQLCRDVRHARHPRRPADEQHLAHLLWPEAGVTKRALNGPDEPLEQRSPRRFRLLTRDRRFEVNGALAAERQLVQRHRRRRLVRELPLGPLRRGPHARPGHAVGAQVDLLLLERAPRDQLRQLIVEVVAAEPHVARGRLDLDYSFEDLEHRDVEGAAAEIDHDRLQLAMALMEGVGERGRRRLVDDALHLQADDRRGIARGLPLRIVEVGRHGDDRFADRMAERRLRVAFERAEDHRRQLLGAELHGTELVDAVEAHVTLERQRRALGMRRRARPRGVAHQHRAVLGHAHRARSQRFAERVRQHDGAPRLHDRDQRIGGAEIDSDNHVILHGVGSAAGWSLLHS
jgi:hypothetical protein